MKPEPLKGKEQEITFNGRKVLGNNILFIKEDVAAAVAWLKKNIDDSIMDQISEIIDEAFPDVVEK